MKEPLLLGHRGFSGVYPENTPIAFMKVADTKADGIETDVHICKSGELVICHDEKVDRTSNGSGYIQDMTYDELLALDFGAWKDPAFAGQRIWTLGQLLDFCKEAKLVLNVELKNGLIFYPELERRVADEIMRRKMEDQVFVSSFNHVSMERFKALGTPIEAGLLYESPLVDMAGYLSRCAADNVHPCYRVFNYQPELVDLFHSRGMKINVWTVNEEDDARKLLDMGIDGLIGNYPDMLCRVAGR